MLVSFSYFACRAANECYDARWDAEPDRTPQHFTDGSGCTEQNCTQRRGDVSRFRQKRFAASQLGMERLQLLRSRQRWAENGQKGCVRTMSQVVGCIRQDWRLLRPGLPVRVGLDLLHLNEAVALEFKQEFKRGISKPPAHFQIWEQISSSSSSSA